MYLPAAHAVHTLLLLSYLPAGHALQESAPVTEIKPPLQSAQVPDPALGEYFPAAHCVQVVEPVVLKLPGLHLVHAAAKALLKEPAGQLTQLE
jgi:hypothetical protein